MLKYRLIYHDVDFVASVQSGIFLFTHTTSEIHTKVLLNECVHRWYGLEIVCRWLGSVNIKWYAHIIISCTVQPWQMLM